MKKNLSKILAGMAFVSAMLVSCEKNVIEQPNTLEVVPSSSLTFLASGNSAVSLSVKTDAASWDFKAPEWVVAEKSGDKLSVNVADNTGASRVGRIEFTAGTADMVSVAILQAAPGEVPTTKVGATLIDADRESSDLKVSVLSSEPEYTSTLKLVLENPAPADLEVALTLDPDFLTEYAFLHEDIDCTNLDAASVNFSGKLLVKAGETESSPVTVTLNTASAAMQVNYLIPVVVDEAKCPEALVFTSASKRVNYLLKKKLPKEIKNVVYLEVNNTNPLNMLEYKLEDGSPFFDVVILFAANVNYDGDRDVVYLHNNPNVQALLDDTDIYLQPLREAGMEVQLGLLPNHTAAGLVNLSDKGAQMFAYDVANACATYKLDGASLDEEYRSGSSNSDLFKYPYNGLNLCYFLKQEFAEQCAWPCQVSLFDYNWTGKSPIEINGVTYDPSELIDFYVANYYGSSYPWSGTNFTLKNCSGASIECNLGYSSVNETSARNMKNNGYGWCMWFAFHPQEGGGINNNASRIDPMIQGAARGFYDQELAEPKYYYKKLGEGKYDPTRYNRWE